MKITISSGGEAAVFVFAPVVVKRTAGQIHFGLPASKYPEDWSPEKTATRKDEYYRGERGLELPAMFGCYKTIWASDGNGPLYTYTPFYGSRDSSEEGLNQILVPSFGELAWINIRIRDMFWM